MKIYQGNREPNAAGPGFVTVGGRPLHPRNNVRDHSPDGFQWGYGGSGPAQLALAICVDAVGVERGKSVYQEFKWRMIAGLRTDEWTMTEERVLEVIGAIELQRHKEREKAHDPCDPSCPICGGAS